MLLTVLSQFVPNFVNDDVVFCTAESILATDEPVHRNTPATLDVDHPFIHLSCRRLFVNQENAKHRLSAIVISSNASSQYTVPLLFITLRLEYDRVSSTRTAADVSVGVNVDGYVQTSNCAHHRLIPLTPSPVICAPDVDDALGTI